MEPLPINIRDWRSNHRDKVIEDFVVSGLAKVSNPNPENTNQQLVHWRAAGHFMATSRGYRDAFEQSTLFDTERQLDYRVEVQFRSLPYGISRNSVAAARIPLRRIFTTTDMYNFILQKGLNRYMFNGNGSGCLTWTLRLARHLEQEGILPPGSVSFIETKVQEVRDRGRYWVPDETGALFY